MGEPGGLPSMGSLSRTRLKRLSSSIALDKLGEARFLASQKPKAEANRNYYGAVVRQTLCTSESPAGHVKPDFWAPPSELLIH